MKEFKENGKVVVDVLEFGSKEISSDVFFVNWIMCIEYVCEYIFNVIEFFFGIGCILYVLCEYVYWVCEGDDEVCSVLFFLVIVVLIKVFICLFFGNKEFIFVVCEFIKKFCVV